MPTHEVYLKYKESHIKYTKKYRLKHRDHLNKCRREDRLKNPERYRERERLYKYNLKIKILTHYSKGKPECKCCKEQELLFLTIDHINNDGYTHRQTIRRSELYKWLYKHDFPIGFQVLCFNCNCGRVINNGVCPHKNKI